MTVSSSKSVFEKTCATTQKNVKSRVFFILEKNVKNVENVRIVSQASLITPAFNPPALSSLLTQVIHKLENAVSYTHLTLPTNREV